MNGLVVSEYKNGEVFASSYKILKLLKSYIFKVCENFENYQL